MTTPGAEPPGGGERTGSTTARAAAAAWAKPARSPWARRAHWLGGTLAIAAAGWVVASLVRGAPGAAGTGVETSRLIAAAAAAAALYAGLGVIAAAAWWRCLGLYGRRPPIAPAVGLWARTQAAKYLPGNVFHYVGRQVLGRRMGVSHAELAASAALELATVLVAAAALTAAGSAAAPGGSLRLSAAAGAAALAALVGLVAADALIRRLPPLSRLAEGLPPLSRRRTAAAALPALGLHLVVLAGTAGILWGLVAAGWPGGAPPLGAVLAAYPLAWAAGTLTPGAPGGIGVREAALAVQLAPFLGEAPAALAAIALRAVTVGGDLLLAGAAWALRGREDGEASQPER